MFLSHGTRLRAAGKDSGQVVEKTKCSGSQYGADRRGGPVRENEVRIWRTDGSKCHLVRVQPLECKKTRPEALQCRERCRKVRLVDSTCAWHGDNAVTIPGVLFSRLVLFLFPWFVSGDVLFLIFRGFGGAEVITRAHDVGSIRIHGWVKSHAPEHGEHLRSMSAAAQDDK